MFVTFAADRGENVGMASRVLLAGIAALMAAPVAAQTPPLSVSANHRYLEAGGKPFFWLGDTGWLLLGEPPTALQAAGLAGARLYPGSWSEWCAQPDAVVACVGGGSNAIGIFHPYIEVDGVRLIGVEAAARSPASWAA